MGVFDENLEANLQQLAQELKSGTFEPFPVRRVYIPKAGGRVRPLGITNLYFPRTISAMPDEVKYHDVDDPKVRERLLNALDPVSPARFVIVILI